MDHQARVVINRINLNFRIKVTNITDDRLVFHAIHMTTRNNINITGSGDEDIAKGTGIVHLDYGEALHSSLQRTDGVNLGDEYHGTHAAKSLGTALANIPIPEHNALFTGHHDIGSPFDAVEKRLSAAVEVVELAFGYRIVDVKSREHQATFTSHLIEAMDSGGGLFTNSFEPFGHTTPKTRIFFQGFIEQQVDDGRFLVVRRYVR